jgi:ferritin-like metal-binding protein YciE
MGLFSGKALNSLEQLFIDQLQDLYDAEHRITEALPKMAEAADSPQLAQAFRDHLQETERQIERLERVFEIVGQKAKRKACEAMKGLVTEGNEVIAMSGNADVRDAALIAAAQRVEHYEMAGYGCVRTYARRLGYTEAEELLQATLDEEGATDHKLTALAETIVNPQAQAASQSS